MEQPDHPSECVHSPWNLLPLKRGDQVASDCAHRPSTFLLCAVCEHVRRLVTLHSPYSPLTGMYMTFPCRLTSRRARSDGLIGSANR